jgi:CheY-like chemotaxis protein
VEAQNGQNALEMLDAGKVKPNVILTDVMMPGIKLY